MTDHVGVLSGVQSGRAIRELFVDGLLVGVAGWDKGSALDDWESVRGRHGVAQGGSPGDSLRKHLVHECQCDEIGAAVKVKENGR